MVGVAVAFLCLSSWQFVPICLQLPRFSRCSALVEPDIPYSPTPLMSNRTKGELYAIIQVSFRSYCSTEMKFEIKIADQNLTVSASNSSIPTGGAQNSARGCTRIIMGAHAPSAPTWLRALGEGGRRGGKGESVGRWPPPSRMFQYVPLCCVMFQVEAAPSDLFQVGSNTF